MGMEQKINFVLVGATVILFIAGHTTNISVLQPLALSLLLVETGYLGEKLFLRGKDTLDRVLFGTCIGVSFASLAILILWLAKIPISKFTAVFTLFILNILFTFLSKKMVSEKKI